MCPVRRNSKQRRKIFELIRVSRSHPTAQRVYDALKKDTPSLSLGNVYRNIHILIEEGKITGRAYGDGIEHYDAITDAHYHFICSSCGEVIDFPMPIKEVITREAQEISTHFISGHTIQFHGICEQCRKSGMNTTEQKSKGERNER